MKLPSGVKHEEFEDPAFTMARGDYNSEQKTIAVFTKLEMNTKANDLHIRLELVAEFRVDENLFPKDRVHEWAQKAAFLVIYPFLREHIYSLSVKVGLPPIIIPMVNVPSYSITVNQPSLFPVEGSKALA